LARGVTPLNRLALATRFEILLISPVPPSH
jgi:hypothetical protein